MDEPQRVEPLFLCPNCLSEMRLYGAEQESDTRDIYTFQCGKTRQLALVKAVSKSGAFR
jgi:hypothetical protein